jgi:hypothetical protein
VIELYDDVPRHLLPQGAKCLDGKRERVVKKRNPASSALTGLLKSAGLADFVDQATSRNLS